MEGLPFDEAGGVHFRDLFVLTPSHSSPPVVSLSCLDGMANSTVGNGGNFLGFFFNSHLAYT